jgi:biotin carboxylase
MSNRKNAVVIIAAGEQQVCLIKKAKHMGFAVIAVDINPKALGFDISDEKIICSTYDATGIIEHLEAFAKKYALKGVLTKSSGIPVLTTAKISHHFTLPGVAPQTAEKIIDKHQLLVKCKQFNIPIPKHIATDSFKKINLSEISFPVVMKPALASGGKRGVFFIENLRVLGKHFPLVKALSLNRIVEIEEYIRGKDIVFIGLISGGAIHKIAFAEELVSISKEGNFKSLGFQILANYQNDPITKKITRIAKDFIHKFELENTFISMAFKVNSNEIRLIEIHLDLGGDNIADILIPSVTTVDILKETIKVLTGGKSCVVKTLNKSGLVYNVFRQDIIGQPKIKLKEVSAVPYVKRTVIFNDKKNNLDNIGYILIKGSNYEIEKATKKINSIFKVNFQ